MLAFFVYILVKLKSIQTIHKTSYAILFGLLFLVVTKSHTDTQLILVSTACCSLSIMHRLSSAWLPIVIALGGYVLFYWNEKILSLFMNPILPNTLLQNSFIFLVGFVLVWQSVIFRLRTKRNEITIRDMKKEIETVNRELRNSNEKLQSMYENQDSKIQLKERLSQACVEGIDTSMYVTISNRCGKFIRVNKNVLSISGYSEDELIGNDYKIILPSGNYPISVFIERKKWLMQGNVWCGQIEHQTKAGALVCLNCVVIPIPDFQGAIQSFLTLGFSVSKKTLNDKIQEETIQVLESIAFSASHKIRGPLARIKGLSNLITKDIVNEHELKMVSEKLVISSEELDEATSDLVAYIYYHQKLIKDRVERI